MFCKFEDRCYQYYTQWNPVVPLGRLNEKSPRGCLRSFMALILFTRNVSLFKKKKIKIYHYCFDTLINNFIFYEVKYSSSLSGYGLYVTITNTDVHK